MHEDHAAIRTAEKDGAASTISNGKTTQNPIVGAASDDVDKLGKARSANTLRVVGANYKHPTLTVTLAQILTVTQAKQSNARRNNTQQRKAKQCPATRTRTRARTRARTRTRTRTIKSILHSTKHTRKKTLVYQVGGGREGVDRTPKTHI